MEKYFIVIAKEEKFVRIVKSQYGNKMYFKIIMEKGTLMFEHVDEDVPVEKRKGIATFNINTNECKVNGKNKPSLTGYFRGYSMGYLGKYSDTQYGCYEDRRKIMKTDLNQIGDWGKFMLDKVIPHFYDYTNHNNKNLGNMLQYVSQFENMYNWNQDGFKIDFITDQKPSLIGKSFRDLLRNKNIKISKIMINKAITDIELFNKLITYLHEEKIPVHGGDYNRNGWEAILNDQNIFPLIREENYDARALIQYMFNYIIPYEGLEARTIISDLRDYGSMHRQMGIEKYKKFPKFLRSKHDIIKSEYNNFKKEFPLKVFKEQTRKELNYEWKKKHENSVIGFIVRVPESPDDLKDEGVQLAHCVGSYIQRVISGETQILFLRDIKNPEISVLTLEVRDDVLIQAKGLENRSVTKEERKKIEQFAKEKKLLVRI